MPVSGVLSPQTSLPRIHSRVCQSSALGILREIEDTRWDMAVWNREMPLDILEAARAFAAQPVSLLLDLRSKPGPELENRVKQAVAGFGPAEFSAWLCRDICGLAGLFEAALECSSVRVRLHRVVDTGCAVFHVDTLSARLLCTYAGAGMEWADEPDVRRNELGLNGRTLAVANGAIVPDSSRIRMLSPGAVAIFKGRLWGDAASHGLVHRSPPGCCEQHARLRLLIDPGESHYWSS